MPFIDVKMFPGRDEETKKKFAEAVLDAAADNLGADKAAFSVAVTEVSPEDWNDSVANKVDEKSIKAGKMYRTK